MYKNRKRHPYTLTIYITDFHELTSCDPFISFEITNYYCHKTKIYYLILFKPSTKAEQGKGYSQQRRSRAKKKPSRSDKPSEATANSPTSDGKAERPAGPASFFLREEIGRNVA